MHYVITRRHPYKPGPGATINWGHPLARGLVGCWLLNEGGGSVVRDIARYHADGSFVNAPTWSHGGTGTAVLFASASSQYITIPYNANADVGNDRARTIDAKFHLTTLRDYNGIFSRVVSNRPGPFDTYVSAAGNLAFFFGNPGSGSSFSQITATGIAATTWYHMIGSADEYRPEARLYVNGTLRASLTTAFGGALNDSATNLMIGNRGDNVTLCNGKVEFCRYWGRFLEQSEAEWLSAEPYAFINQAETIKKYIFLGGSEPQTVSPSAIDSLEAFGSASLIVPQTVSPGAIASLEAFGTAQVSYPQTVSPGGVASLEAFGTPALALILSPSGIVSAEAFGSGQVTVEHQIHPQPIPGPDRKIRKLTGIESEELFGDPTVIVVAGPPTGGGGGGSAARTFDLLIDGSTVFPYLVPETFNRTTGLGSSRGTAQFTLKTYPGSYRPQWGQPVVFVKNGTREFGGIISRVKERWPSGTRAMFIDVECQDWSSVFNRRVCIGKYTAASLQSPAQAGDGVATLQEILESIVENCLDSESFALGTVDTSVMMAVGDEFNFKGTVAEAFNQLGAYFQVDWWCDWYKTINFSAFTSNPAPFGLTETNRDLICSANSVVLTRGAGSYRNVQYVRSASSPIGIIKSVSRWGDGTTRAFDATETMTKVPRVFVTALGPGATTEKYVVRKSEITGPPIVPPAGYDPDWWFWHDNEVDKYRVQQWFIFTPPQGNGNPNNVESDKIVIQWESSIPNQASASDDTAIAARQAIEGGSGKWEAIEDQVTVAGGTAADTLSDGLTIRNDEEIVLEFETSVDGLRPGMLMSVNLTHPLIAADMLIESISSAERNASLSLSPAWWVHQVRLVADSVGKQRRDDLRKWIEDVNAKLRTPPLTQQQILNFWFPAGTLASGTDLTNHISPRRPGIAAHLVILAKTPLDDDLVFDINRGGVSICGSTKPTLFAGQTIAVYNDWAESPLRLVVDDIMTCDCDSVGAADVSGEDLTIELAMSG